MKKFSRFIFSLLAAVFFLLPVQGCEADDFALNSYKTLESSAITYNMVMGAAADMRASGTLDEDKWDELREAALVYYDAYQTAVSALALYMGVLEATDGKAQTKANIQELVDAVSTGISDLLTCAVKLGITIKEAVNE